MERLVDGMLKFFGTSSYVEHFYYFTDDKGNYYYWKTNKEDVANSCVQYGRLFGINTIEYEIKKNGKLKSYEGKVFTEIKVTKWEVCK